MCYRARKYVSWTILAAAVLLLPQAAQAGRKVLRLLVDGPMLEAPDEAARFFAIFSNTQSNTLHEWVEEIEKAAAEDDVAGIAMIIEAPSFGAAQLEEMSRALQDFRKTGKKVYCYMDTAGNGTYALACAADRIMLAEHSDLGIVGIHAEASYYKGLLDKIGVQADMMHCGAYKSALEPFTRTEPSPEAAENINWLLDGIYGRWIEMVANGRGLSTEQVKALVDRAPLSAKDAFDHKLIDKAGSFDDFKELIHKELGEDVEVVKRLGEKPEEKIDFENPFAMFQMFAQKLTTAMEQAGAPAKPAIGLIYVEGLIMVGKQDTGPFASTAAASAPLRAAFDTAREDDNIKAVVVRVDSPGGSALASDIIWKAETRCAAEKPVIVSMGNVAGSGGYYVSIPGDTIFAEETTITASIGVVGGKLVWDDLMQNKLGITTTEFDRGKHAGLMSMNHPWNDDERAWMTKFMNEVYGQFKDRVRQSRGDRIKGNLDDMAGGRVYTGQQALERGLVDRIGGLSDAIKFTAGKVGLSEYDICILPKQKNPLEMIVAALTGEQEQDDWEMSTSANFTTDPVLRMALPLLQNLAPPQFRNVARALSNIVTLNREHVGCFMPFDVTIR